MKKKNSVHIQNLIFKIYIYIIVTFDYSFGIYIYSYDSIIILLNL
jgi:hypothetical protein